MAMLETKIIQVENSPTTINNCNTEWGYFGWSVQNVQVTYSQDTRTYTKGWLDYQTGSKTVETTTVNYATITYQRDKHMPNYQQIVKLENDYAELIDELESAQAAATPSFGKTLKAFTAKDWIIALFLYMLGGFPGIIFCIYRYNTLKHSATLVSNDMKELLDTLKDRRNRIIQQAEQLLGE